MDDLLTISGFIVLLIFTAVGVLFVIGFIIKTALDE
jgi:hypothetical protein